MKERKSRTLHFLCFFVEGRMNLNMDMLMCDYMMLNIIICILILNSKYTV